MSRGATFGSRARRGSLVGAVLAATLFAAGAGHARGDEIDPPLDDRPPQVSLTVRASRFSPDGDGRRDRTRFEVVVDEPAELQLEILDRTGAPLQAWSPIKVETSPLTFSWSGRSGDTRLPDGRYTARVTAVDEVGLLSVAEAPVWIDTRRPRLRILSVASPSDANGSVRIRYRVRDASPRVRLRLQLRGDFGTIRTRRFRRATGRGTLWLKPRYRNGRRLFPGGYRVHLRATDPAANDRARRAPLVVLRRVAPRVYTRLQGTGRRVALTFDDCIFPAEWGRILNILKRRRVKATFFCPGDRISMHRALARRVVREGHVPASHGWGHPMLTGLAYSEVVARLTSDRQQWASVGGVSAPYFRPPYGAFNSTVLHAAAATSHPRVVMWDIDSRDTAGASGRTLVCNVVCHARPGSIILMHTKPVTAAALPAILDGLEARGLKPVTLPRLFRAAGFH